MSLVEECEIMKIHGREHKTINKIAKLFREDKEYNNCAIIFEMIYGL